MTSLTKNKSKQLSFYQLFAQEHYGIEIPIIQRDYAQGRSSAKSVRNDFLKALYQYLTGNHSHQDLDFVYGDIQNGVLVPLDGQQRLTTLFLLHWYLAAKEGQYTDFKKVLSDRDHKSRFKYSTRISSTDFCNALLKQGLALELTQDSISTRIKDANWYFPTWDNDPTIQSMLTMLDAIHEVFKNTKELLYRRLTDFEKPFITFQFLPLSDYGLSDDLYIKMNARGKPLTTFEHFKAKFAQYIEKVSTQKYEWYGKDIPAKTYFENKIDGQWVKLFWQYRDKSNTYDQPLMNFIGAIAIGHEASQPDAKHIKASIDKSELSLDFFTKRDESFVADLIETFDILCKEKHYKLYLPADFHYYKEKEIFEKMIQNNFNDAAYLERIQFYAYYKFLVNWKGSAQGLTDWMRVITNLVVNYIYNDDASFMNAIKWINSWLECSNEIYRHLKTKPGEIKGFLPEQFKEERIKAHLITRDEEWKTLILKSEQHGYFKGQLTFVLAFSGIEAYFDKQCLCDWSHFQNIIFKKAFEQYFQKMASLFSNEGLKATFKDKHLFHRALLVKGDYLLYAKSNWSFLIDHSRDISWKRLLLGDGDRTTKRFFLKNLLDDLLNLDIQVTDLEPILQQDISAIAGWRQKFIELPELWNEFGQNKYIRSKNNDDIIYLLKGERTSSFHAELNTLYLYYKWKTKWKYIDIFYERAKGDDEVPRLKWVYNDFIISVKYVGEFIIYLDYKNTLDFNFQKVVRVNGFEQDSNNFWFLECNSQDELEKQLKKLFDSLK